MMSYRNFRRLVEKKLDAWIEVVLFDPISTFLSFIICSFGKFKTLPYFLTILSFLLRAVGAVSLFYSQINLAVLLIFLGFVLDGIDGKVSRFVYGKDPEKRGTMDFLLDHVALFLLFLGLGYILIPKSMLLTLMLLIYVASSLLLSTFVSTKFRLFAKSKHDPDKHLLDSGKIQKSSFLNFIFSIQKKLMKYRIIFHPSAVDAEFLIFILFPLFNFNFWLISIGIIFVWVDLIISGAGPIYLLIRD